MRPVRLEMQGFGAFREPTEIDFDGIELLALVGATGSGKSTIIDAVTFALYGSIARYDDNRAVAPVINQTSTRARVRLDFELGGHAYTAVRLVQRNKTGATTKEARLERGDEVLAADARGMSAAVGELLGLDVDQFNRTVVLPQGRFADFLHDKPGDRQDTLRQLLGIEMYNRIGKAARARAAEARQQIAALQPDVDEGETGLTDEHRSELTDRIEAVVAARQRFVTDCGELEVAQTELSELQGRSADLSRRLALLDHVELPGGVDELEARRRDAVLGLDQARATADAAKERQRGAVRAAADGPDLAETRAQLKLHRDAVALADEHERIERALAEATARADSARQAAEAVAAAQRHLDEAVDDARRTEAAAREAVTSGPDPGQIDGWLKLHERRSKTAAELSELRAVEARAQAELEPLVSAAERAEATERNVQQAVDDIRQRVGAAGYVSVLAVGEPCPLCLQEVHDIPSHDLDGDVRAAEQRLSAAQAERRLAVKALDDARRAHTEAAAAVKAQENVLLRTDEDLVGVSDVDALRLQLDDARERRSKLDAAADATGAAELASVTHREQPRNVTTLEAAAEARDVVTGHTSLETDLRGRLATARAAVAELPDESQLERQIAEAERLAAALREAGEEVHRTDDAVRTASLASEQVADETKAAVETLMLVRDRVAVLDPPAIAPDELAAGWHALGEWAERMRAQLTSEHERVEAEVAATSQRLAALDRDARSRCVDALGDPTFDIAGVALTDVRERLAGIESERRGELAALDERRQRLEALRERVGRLQEDSQVADKLGHLLRVDGFEGWLMQAALEELVDAATVRLHELSAGQFSLVLDDRDFAVRDHANADELRSARTLSGGETFLASLSLALALAEATADLAPEGAPGIESIFLDEGFGTLDPDALDTVAAAIEELGAGGRMVGIVTHIRELAERMPVRLEVTKAAGSSTVERVEV